MQEGDARLVQGQYSTSQRLSPTDLIKLILETQQGIGKSDNDEALKKLQLGSYLRDAEEQEIDDFIAPNFFN